MRPKSRLRARTGTSPIPASFNSLRLDVNEAVVFFFLGKIKFQVAMFLLQLGDFSLLKVNISYVFDLLHLLTRAH